VNARASREITQWAYDVLRARENPSGIGIRSGRDAQETVESSSTTELADPMRLTVTQRGRKHIIRNTVWHVVPAGLSPLEPPTVRIRLSATGSWLCKFA
jgi:hypothetical protein